MLPLIAIAFVVPTWLVPTWIVDGSNGPGTNFTDLPAAVAAAASGDTIIVRSGTYTPFNVSGKALTILGAGANITAVSFPVPAGAASGETVIQAVPAGATFYISGLGFTSQYNPFPLAPQPTAALRVLASPGPVVLSGLVVQGVSSNGPAFPGLAVSNAQVHASRCTFGGSSGDPALSSMGGAGTTIINSVFVADESTFQGAGGIFSHYSGGSGIDLQGGFATVSHCSAVGGSGIYAGGAAVSLSGPSFLRAAGTSVDSFSVGTSLTGGATAVSAGLGSSAVLHGAITLIAGGMAPPTSGAVTIGAPVLPYISMTGTAAPGGDLSATQPVTVTLNGLLPSAPFALVIDVAPGFSPAFAPLLLGELLVPFPPAVISEGVLDAMGMAQIVVLPSSTAPALVGVPLYVQFGVLDAAAGNVRMSNCQIRRFQ